MPTSTSLLYILCAEYGYPKNSRGGGLSEEADVWLVPLPMTVVRLNETDCSLEVQYDSIVERFQWKALRMIVDAPRYAPNMVIPRDLQIPTVKEEIRRYSSNTVLASAHTQMT
jgi:hypothetical protein